MLSLICVASGRFGALGIGAISLGIDNNFLHLSIVSHTSGSGPPGSHDSSLAASTPFLVDGRTECMLAAVTCTAVLHPAGGAAVCFARLCTVYL